MIDEPKAPKRNHRVTAHGDVREDMWFWLRDKNDPETMRYLNAENAYTKAVMADTEALQAALYREMRGRMKEDDDTVPEREGGFYYYVRFETGAQHPIYCRKYGGEDGDDQVLLDVNALGKGHDFIRVGVCQNSPDHRWLAYSVDLDGSEAYTLHVKDLDTGAVLEEAIGRTYYSLAWANDSRTFFYSVLDEHHRPVRIYRHCVGDDPAQDALVYEEKDARFFVDVQRSLSGRLVYVHSRGNNMDEWWVLDADHPEKSPRLVAARQPNFEYDVVDHSDRFFILNNGGGARDFKISETAIDAPGPENWRDFLAHEPGRLLQDVMAFERHLVVSERRNGLPEIRVMDLDSGAFHHIGFDEAAYVVRPIQGREWQTTTVRFSYMSMKTPERIYDYDMMTRRRTLKKQTPVLGGYNADDYETRRIFATAEDGAQVPISMVFHKNTPLDGSAPLLLYGYGSYGLCMEAIFRQEAVSLLDRGLIWATAHIRGGMEMGRAWYEDGKLLKKKNTFSDFIACAEHVIAAGYTQADRLFASGRSAGGMLMGVVVNWRPELFAGVIAGVPFVDVLNTMLDETLPLTTMEYNEWGNPNDPVFYDYIKSYSPYDHVAAQAYPPMLITGGLNDPRVTYWEPTKWLAKIRDVRTGDALLIMDMKMGAGHAGAAGRFDHLKETALAWAFVLKVLGRMDV